jgi:hypothetical protein
LNVVEGVFLLGIVVAPGPLRHSVHPGDAICPAATMQAAGSTPTEFAMARLTTSRQEAVGIISPALEAQSQAVH